LSHYRRIVRDMDLDDRIVFCGTRDFSLLAHYLNQADILVSPRTRGNNTPMKIYSYLGSAKPILATKLPTHTQVLDETVACLCEPDPGNFAEGILLLAGNPELREKLGESGQRLAREKYSLDAYRKKLADFYQQLFD
ncbi:MAG: glycosyltransferase, partial [Desulfocapsaceae bacterium]|nr:glycosyltransferase [Desulfocapsaceae bacterium]